MRVRDIFSLSGMKFSEIKAGVEGLDRNVKTITVLEVTDVEGQNWLIEGQLYITSLYSAVNNVEKQLGIIQVLINSGSAGIIICHINSWLKKIDQRVVDLCERYDFPLIIANSDTSYIEIMNPIIIKLMAEDSEEYIDPTQMQNKMIELVVNRKDVNVIYRTMSDYYKENIWFLDIENKLIYPKWDEEFSTLSKSVLEESRIINSTNNESDSLVEINESKYIIKRVFSEGTYYGAIIARIDKSKSYHSESILEVISMIFALIATKKSRVSELEKRKREEYLSDLITWNFRSDEVALKLGHEINWDISKVDQIIILNMNIYQENTGEYLRDLVKHIETVQYDIIRGIVKKENPSNLIGIRSDLIIIFMKKDKNLGDDRVSKICNDIIDNWDNDLSGSISIGVSNKFTNLRDIPKSYSQAVEAVKFVREYLGDNTYFQFKDLGAYTFLNQISDDSIIMESLENQFVKLHEYDRENKTDLSKTLEVLLLNNMDINKVSKLMFLHKNTILYRKKKIVEIFGYNPWDMPYLLNSLIWTLLSK